MECGHDWYECDQKPIQGFENYKISECGAVYSTKRKKFLKQMENPKGGYRFILLRRTGESKKHKFYIHRLVAAAFIPDIHLPDDYTQVDHLDGDTGNNHVDNLEWVDNQTNQDRKHRKNSNAKQAS